MGYLFSRFWVALGSQFTLMSNSQKIIFTFHQYKDIQNNKMMENLQKYHAIIKNRYHIALKLNFKFAYHKKI